MQKDKNFSVCVMIVLLVVLGIAAVIVLPQGYRLIGRAGN